MKITETKAERTFTLEVNEATMEFLHAIARCTGCITSMYILSDQCEHLGVGVAKIKFVDGSEEKLPYVDIYPDDV